MLKVRDDSRLANRTAIEIINEEMDKTGVRRDDVQQISGKLKVQGGTSVNLRLRFPAVLHYGAGRDGESGGGRPPLSEMDTLDQMSAFWDSIGSVEEFFEPNYAEFFYLIFEHSDKRLQAEWGHSSDTDGLLLDEYKARMSRA